MALFRIPSLFEVIYVCAACLGVYLLYWELTTGRQHQQSIRKHGCKPAKRYKSRDPIFGLDFFFKTSRWARESTLLENVQRTLFPPGTNTIELNVFRYVTIITREAENVKAALSVNFKSFGTLDMPKEVHSLLGDGIFTTEGAAWHQSRELLRPSFARSNVADLDMLETHVGRLIAKIPLDCSMVDLAGLFEQYTFAVSVDFLFGDTDFETHKEGETGSNEDFAEAWQRLSVHLGGGANQGYFWLLHFVLDRIRTNPQIKRDTHRVHGKFKVVPPSTPFAKQIASLGTVLTCRRQNLSKG